MNSGFDNIVNNESLSKKKGSLKEKILVFLLIIFILLAISVFAVYKFFSSQNVFLLYLDGAFNRLEESFVSYQSMSSEFDLKLMGTSTDKDVDSVFEILNKVDLSFDYGIDYQNKFLNMDIDSKYDSLELMNVSLYLDDQSLYMYLQDVYDKYIRTDLEYDESLFEIKDSSDYKNIVSGVHNALKVSLVSDYFESSESTIGDVKVNKTVLKIDKERFVTLRKDLINTLIKDSDFIGSLANVTSMTTEEVKEEFLEELESEVELSEDINFIIYSDNMDFVKFDMVVGDESISVYYNKGVYEYSINVEDVLVDGGVVINSNNKDNTDMIISFNGFGTSVSLDIKGKFLYNNSISKNDVSNSIDYENIDDSTSDDIYSKLREREGIKKIITDISTIYNIDENIDKGNVGEF